MWLMTLKSASGCTSLILPHIPIDVDLNIYPSLFWLPRPPTLRTVPGIAVAARHVNARRVESFDSVRGLPANTPAD
jgi:hypothetical protein